MRQARFVLIDDVDGSTAQETVFFAVGKQQYEIDLNGEHLQEFNRDLDRWLKHARKISSRRTGRVAVAAGGANDAPLIRAWAKERGTALSQRGRIPTSVREQYYAENNKAD